MAVLEEPSAEIPEIMRSALLMLAKHWQALDADERVLERQIAKAARCDREARQLMEVPGVGPIIASTILAKVPDAKVFRSGRDFAAWIGLTGRDHGTGGKHRPGHISKQGDRMLRVLLISGASAHLRQQKRARCQRSMAARVARAAALQGRHGGLRRQNCAHHLGHAGQGRTLPQSRERAGCCLVEGDSRRARAYSVRKGNQGVMANGQETWIETLRFVIARHSAPK